MKKTVYLLLCFPILFFGQKNSLETGIFLGGAHNSLNCIEAPQNTNPNSQLNLPIGGLLVQYNFNNRISLKTKLLYHTKGAENFVISNDGNISETEKKNLFLHYIKAPFLTQINFGSNNWGCFFNSGFYMGFLIGSEAVYNDVKMKTPLEDYKKTDIGLSLGGGISFKINDRSKLFLESTWDYGLSNISKIELARPNSVMTESITANIGITYNFPIKPKTFNGLSKLDCPEHDNTPTQKEKRKSKWRLVLYKDGEKVVGKKKKGKSRLFKKQ